MTNTDMYIQHGNIMECILLNFKSKYVYKLKLLNKIIQSFNMTNKYKTKANITYTSTF